MADLHSPLPANSPLSPRLPSHGGGNPPHSPQLPSQTLADPYGRRTWVRDGFHTDGGGDGATSASVSDAGSTATSTNQNSIFSATNTVRFGNVLSLEDFKGCPCPLDDIMEHEGGSGRPAWSPGRSVRVNQSSRAASPDQNHDNDDHGDEVLSNPPDQDEPFPMGGLDDEDDDAMLQLAMYASLGLNDGEHSSPRLGSSPVHGLEERDSGTSFGWAPRLPLDGFQNGRDERAPHLHVPTTGMSAIARGKLPVGVQPGGSAQPQYPSFGPR